MEELRRKLQQRRCRPEEIGETLERMSTLGYLDDAAFARALVDRRSSSRGPALIAQELAAKGVPRATAQEALSVLDHDHQVAAARLLAARVGPGQEERLVGRLQRQGFSRPVIREALGNLPDEG